MLGPLCFIALVAAVSSCKPCTCGVVRGARVVGGQAAIPGEFPWLAALMKDGKFVCGATVVARDHLITATHCVHGYAYYVSRVYIQNFDCSGVELYRLYKGKFNQPPEFILEARVEASRLSVLVGEYDVNKTRGHAFDVAHVVQHPDFNRFTYDNDIAVLRISDPLPDYLYRPACLPDMDDASYLEGLDAIVSGWGATIEKGPSSNIPMKAEVQIWAHEECTGAGYGKRKVTPRMLCANAPDRDACSGDSGGPLLVPQPHFTVVGIVSWGRGCARQGYPGVYARVDRFLPWLKVALRHACLCEPPSLYK